MALRLVLVTLLVLTLADVRVSRPTAKRSLIAVVDLSDSARASEEQATDAVKAIQQRRTGDDLFGVVTFGRDAQVEIVPTRTPGFENFQSRPDGAYSDLAGALRLAGNLLPEDSRRQVAVLSDGRQNLGDAAEAVQELRGRSIRVDVLPLGAPPSAEALVLALDSPHELRVGQSLLATARLRSNGATRGRLALQLDGREIASRDVELPAGDSRQTFDLPPLDAGSHVLGVSLDAQPDTYVQNNTAGAVVRVVGRPSVLLLEGAAGEGANMVSALRAGDVDVESRAVEQSPTAVAEIARHDAVVVVDAPATGFPKGAMEAIATSVRDLGRGLVTVGGSRSYGPGKWQGTPLEDALPVRMDLPKRTDRPALAVALVMETMESPEGDSVALGAAESVVDQLTPEDELVVVNLHQDGSYLLVPRARVPDKDSVKRRIAQTELGDPPGYASGLDLAFDALASSDAANKHAIIIGDGDATGETSMYPSLFAKARDLRITTSAIGVATHGSEADMAHMAEIARLGGGRSYRSNTARDVPQILLDESKTALRPWYEQHSVLPVVTSSSDVLQGVPVDRLPPLDGYVATTAKPTADVVLASPSGDPLLATEQYGSGRSVAWTSDSVGRWTKALLQTGPAAALFGRMVAWALPLAAEGELRLDAAPGREGLDVQAFGPPGAAGELTLDVVGPDQTTSRTQLDSAAPGRWHGTVPAGQAGIYVVRAVLGGTDAKASATAELAVPIPYSPEYLELGRDDGLLRLLAKGGGALLNRAQDVWAMRPPRAYATDPTFPLLLLLAAVLWPVDVALRRLTLGPKGLASAIRLEREDRAARRAVLEVPKVVLRLRGGKSDP